MKLLTTRVSQPEDILRGCGRTCRSEASSYILKASKRIRLMKTHGDANLSNSAALERSWRCAATVLLLAIAALLALPLQAQAQRRCAERSRVGGQPRRRNHAASHVRRHHYGIPSGVQAQRQPGHRDRHGSRWRHGGPVVSGVIGLSCLAAALGHPSSVGGLEAVGSAEESA